MTLNGDLANAKYTHHYDTQGLGVAAFHENDDWWPSEQEGVECSLYSDSLDAIAGADAIGHIVTSKIFTYHYRHPETEELQEYNSEGDNPEWMMEIMRLPPRQPAKTSRDPRFVILNSEMRQVAVINATRAEAIRLAEAKLRPDALMDGGDSA